MGGGASVGANSHMNYIFMDENIEKGGVTLCTDSNARMSFVCYIKSCSWYYTLPWYEGTLYKSATLGGSIDAANDRRAIVLDGKRTQSKSPIMSDDGSVGSPRLDNIARKDVKFNTSCLSDDQIISFMLAILYQNYLNSKHYDHWLQCGDDQNFQPYKEDDRENSPKQSSMKLSEAKPPSLDEILERNKDKACFPLEDVFLLMAHQRDANDFSARLLNTQWIETYIKAIDSCPVSLSVAAADARRTNEFPIIYGNQVFAELVGGKSRAGKMVRDNEHFVECVAGPKTLSEEKEKMNAAMLLNKVVRVEVVPPGSSCGTKTLAIRPVNDAEGKCRYVLGMHFDHSSKDELQIMNEMLTLLPHVMRDNSHGSDTTTPSYAARSHKKVPLPKVTASNSGSNRNDGVVDVSKTLH